MDNESRVGLADSAHPTPDLFEQLCREQAVEITRLQAEIDQLQAAQAIVQKRAAIAALLVEHGLPPLDAPSAAGRGLGRGKRDNDPATAIVSDSFIQSLFAAPSEVAIRTLIRERAALVEQARLWTSEAPSRGTMPVSREQTLVESRHDNSLDAFLKAVRA